MCWGAEYIMSVIQLSMCLSVFSDMRKIGSSQGAVTAYPRQLESLIRLAEAHAKMRSGTQCYTLPIYLSTYGWYAMNYNFMVF